MLRLCLLISDVHKLFDTGYLTITNHHKTQVTKRIKEEFENGKEYYQFHVKSLLYLSEEITNQPKLNLYNGIMRMYIKGSLILSYKLSIAVLL